MKMEFWQYRLLLVGCSMAMLVFIICMLMLLRKRLLAEMIEKLFEIIRIDCRTLLMDFFGHHVNLRSSRRFRLSVMIQLAEITSIALILILDGCIMQVQYLSKKDTCPTQESDCFTFGKSSTHERIVCPSGESLANITSSNAVCFVWIYAEQNAVSILNQIGICSSVFSLLCHSFKLFCRLSRKCWGLLLLILLILTFESIIIVALVFDLGLSMTARLLLFSLSCLMINVIQLLHFTRRSKSHHSLPWTTKEEDQTFTSSSL